jgi:hypothetical protein
MNPQEPLACEEQRSFYLLNSKSNILVSPSLPALVPTVLTVSDAVSHLFKRTQTELVPLLWTLAAARVNSCWPPTRC